MPALPGSSQSPRKTWKPQRGKRTTRWPSVGSLEGSLNSLWKWSWPSLGRRGHHLAGFFGGRLWTAATPREGVLVWSFQSHMPDSLDKGVSGLGWHFQPNILDFLDKDVRGWGDASNQIVTPCHLSWCVSRSTMWNLHYLMWPANTLDTTSFTFYLE